MVRIVEVDDEANLWYFVGANPVDNCVYVGSVTTRYVENTGYLRIHKIRRYNHLVSSWQDVCVIKSLRTEYCWAFSSDYAEMGMMEVDAGRTGAEFHVITLSDCSIKAYEASGGLPAVNAQRSNGGNFGLRHLPEIGWLFFDPHGGFTLYRLALDVPSPDKKKKQRRCMCWVDLEYANLVPLLSVVDEDSAPKPDVFVVGYELLGWNAHLFCRIKGPTSEENQLWIYNLEPLMDMDRATDNSAQENLVRKPMGKSLDLKPRKISMGLDAEECDRKVPELKDFHGKLFTARDDIYFASVSIERVGMQRANFVNVFRFHLPESLDSLPEKCQMYSWKFVLRLRLPDEPKIVASTALLNACSDGWNIYSKMVMKKDRSDQLIQKSKPSVDRIGLIPFQPLSLQALAIKGLSSAMPILGESDQEVLIEQLGISRRIVARWFSNNPSREKREAAKAAETSAENAKSKGSIGKLKSLFKKKK